MSGIPGEAQPIGDDAGRADIARRMQAFGAISLALTADVAVQDLTAIVWRELHGEVCGVVLYLDDEPDGSRLVAHAGFSQPPPAAPATGIEARKACLVGQLLAGEGDQSLVVPDGSRPAWLGPDAVWLMAVRFGDAACRRTCGHVLFALRPDTKSPALCALLQQVAQRMGECMLVRQARAGMLGPPGVSPPLKVLLIDDEPLLQNYVGQLLLHRGFEFHGAQAALPGLALARAIRPDILLLDKVLPDMDGIALLCLVRRDQQLSTVPVIMLSGQSDEAGRIRALRAGADDFVAKPFSAGELVARIHANINMAQARRAAVWRESELLRLRQSQQELRKLLDTIQNVRSEERRLLSREIHDQLGQLLTAAKIDIRLLQQRSQGAEVVAPTELAGELGSALSSIDQAIASVQDISILLRPPSLEDNGLVGALRWLAMEFEQRSKLACTVQHVEAGYIEPSLFVAGELFRICQEALTNVLRHADATRVLVQISVRGRDIRIRVCDDGVGIARALAQSPRAIGLTGMRERAASIRAKLRIYGSPGRGTVIAVRRRVVFS